MTDAMCIDADEELIAFPLDGDEIERLGSGDVRLINAAIGSEVVVGRDVFDVMGFFGRGASIAESTVAFRIDETRVRELLRPLITSFMIVRSEDLGWLRWGITRPCAHGVGPRVRIPELRKLDISPDFAVFGVGLDLGGAPGPRSGPGEIRRKLSIPDATSGGPLDFDAARTVTRLPRIVDLGDIAYMGGESMETVGRRISLVLREAWARSITPIMLGGDHSWTHFALRELFATRQELGIIHFGAQADVFPMRHGLLTHGNVFLPALESPALRCLLQLGLRGLVSSYGRLSFSDAVDERVRYVPARRLEELSPEDVLAGIPRDLPYYVTFDATVLDARETGGPVVGGMSHYTGVGLFEYLCRNFQIVGADFVEVAGSPTRRNRAAESTARYLLELLSSRATIAARPS